MGVEIGHVIQQAVAPVFLISGVGATLAVLTNRLARIVDRARLLERELVNAAAERSRAIHADLYSLSRRAKLINWAITLCTTCALFVCAVIACLFLGSFFGIMVAPLVALLFVAAMSAFFIGLLLFLREIFIATATLRIGPH
ncbi:MAG: DUF2721 domain-containing protein [Planctomycetota bacterium]